MVKSLKYSMEISQDTRPIFLYFSYLDLFDFSWHSDEILFCQLCLEKKCFEKERKRKFSWSADKTVLSVCYQNLYSPNNSTFRHFWSIFVLIKTEILLSTTGTCLWLFRQQQQPQRPVQQAVNQNSEVNKDLSTFNCFRD